MKQSDLLDRILEALAARPARASAASRAPARAERQLRVLVAEDNVVNQRVAVGLLERVGHRAVVVTNGRQALAALEKEPFDLVLMDVQMPEMDGFEATAAIREREVATGRRIPIVAVTAHAMKGDAERCLAAGMDAYLAKPLQPRELASALSALSSGRAAIDGSRLLERVGGDRRALREVARLFLADAPRRLAEIRRAIARGDVHALRTAAHTLKGAVANFAAPAATEAALELQKLGDASDLAEAPLAFERLKRELAAVRRALQDLIGRPKPARKSAARRQHRPRLSRGT